MIDNKQRKELNYLLDQHMLNLAINYWLDHQNSIYAEKLFWETVIDGSEVLRDKAMYKVDIDKVDRDTYYLKQGWNIKPLGKKDLTSLLNQLSTFDAKSHLKQVKTIEL